MGVHEMNPCVFAWITKIPVSAPILNAPLVIVALCSQAEILGGNAICPIALYEIDRRVLGMQGHPEFSLGIMQDLLPVMAKKLEPAMYEVAVRSLDNGTPDNQLVAHWLVNFLL